MNGGFQDERDTSSGLSPEPGGEDDEPTLETPAEARDDEPTLETPAEVVTDKDGRFDEGPRSVGWGSRLEQMTAANRERRRRVIKRFWIAAVPVVVLIVVAAVLLAVLGRQDGGQGTSSTTVAQLQPAEGSGLLLVETEGVLTWAVLLQPWDGGGVVFAVPGITLLEEAEAFRTVAEIYRAGGRAAVRDALADALRIPIGPTVSASWSDLQAAMLTASVQGLSDGGAVGSQEQPTSVASAVRTLIAEYSPATDVGPWEELALEGDGPEFLRAVGVDSLSMTESVWMATALTGNAVNGEGFVYLEPDLEEARAVLVVTVEARTVVVEIKDGAGVEGAARLAGSLLETGGFELLPMGYAEDYPAVQATQIFTGPGTREEAGQIQSLLGVGAIVVDSMLAADQVVVVLGMDFGQDPAEGTSATE